MPRERATSISGLVSAVKVDGRRLHTLARQGVEIERAPRTVSVHRFEVTAGEGAGVYRVVVECSSGTYVRVLAADLGAALGGGAHLRNLRRTNVGTFTEAEARPLSVLGTGTLLSPAAALRDLGAVTVAPEVAGLVARGLPLDRVPLGATGGGPWALLGDDGRLLAVYEATGTDRIRPAVVLAD
jgi:tRNA pseudouridine55 synthase